MSIAGTLRGWETFGVGKPSGFGTLRGLEPFGVENPSGLDESLYIMSPLCYETVEFSSDSVVFRMNYCS